MTHAAVAPAASHAVKAVAVTTLAVSREVRAVAVIALAASRAVLVAPEVWAAAPEVQAAVLAARAVGHADHADKCPCFITKTVENPFLRQKTLSRL